MEILYVPAFGKIQPLDGLFEEHADKAEVMIKNLIFAGILAPRLNTLGREAMGPKNKLTVHCATGIPVDLFSATESNWWNYLVCRTGGADNNTRLAMRAQELGYKWRPYHAGFERLSDRTVIPVHSEREVFEFLGLPYLEPWERQ